MINPKSTNFVKEFLFGEGKFIVESNLYLIYCTFIVITFFEY